MRALGLAVLAVAFVIALAGCGDSEKETRLTIVAEKSIDDDPADDTIEFGTEIVRFELRCNPPGGTVPDPAAACDAIEKYPAMTEPPEMTGTCAGDQGAPPGISIRGVAEGREVVFEGRGCDLPRSRGNAVLLWFTAVGLQIPER